MEIVIKAKQRGGLDQFGFLEFDHPLNAYYKYISKLIREKKYIPKPFLSKRRPESNNLESSEGQRSLDSAAEKNSGSESDSDFDSEGDGNDDYLHPLLMGRLRKNDSRSNSPVIGPKTKEEHEAANDVYSSLYKSLSDVFVSQAKPVVQAVEEKDEDAVKTKDEPPSKSDYYEWYVSFYGEAPKNDNPTVIPPPPDVMPIVNNTAQYVARYGVQAEQFLSGIIFCSARISNNQLFQSCTNLEKIRLKGRRIIVKLGKILAFFHFQ
ncbi:unnamed protein product [Gongylonema pulchrum]|uniref:SURP motif domain-containing protein n=1 Tax=Gongylonema pulchrum TaxID=637853 RepID=A0A183CZT2_9BILA|nr:unnamed protein product [Gongylonema pulchrum]